MSRFYAALTRRRPHRELPRLTAALVGLLWLTIAGLVMLTALGY